MAKKKYSLTEEHRAQLKPWADRWIKNAMSTTAMTEEDRVICIDAVKRLYREAKLEPPPDHRIIFVSSPFVMRFAAGFAAWIWYLRKNNAATDDATDAATRAATYDATRAATYAATRAATRAATYAATYDATRDATRAATRAATDAATYAATRAATDAATDAATYDATYAATRAATDAADQSNWYVFRGDMVRLAEELGVGKAGLKCAYNAYNFWQGGNQWSGWDAFLSFFRHIVKLDINYTAYDAWETLSLHSGPRCIHAEFCIISDRPELLQVDGENRPHNADGPFCRWRDGTALYSFHGVRTPAWIINHPERLTAKAVLAEGNAEVRRVMVEKMGMEKFLINADAKCIHRHEMGDLFSIDLPNDPERVLRAVRVKDPSTERIYFLRVPPQIKRADDAVAWTFGFDTAKEYRPIVET